MTATESRLSVTDAGAAGDGALATEAFQSALDQVAERGGGTVVVPPGNYTVGTVELHGDTTLHLEAGATVHASQDGADYEALYEEPGPDGEKPFLVARGVENVAITGRGTFDGHGTDVMRMDDPIEGHSGQESAWPLVSEGKPEARQGEAYLDRSAGTEDWPVAKPDFRPGPMFQFADCEDVLIRDVTFRDMPSWTIHVEDCEEVDVLGADVLNHVLIPNCDGIAVVSSRNVHVADCTVVACDDAIVPGTHSAGAPLERLTVTNCTLASHACAIKFGSQTRGDVRDCTFSNCTIYSSNRGLGIQHRDGGDVENVLFQDITIRTTLPPGPWWGKAEPIYVTSVPRHEDTDLGSIRNVRFDNVVAQCENGAVIYAHDEADVADVRLDGVDLHVQRPEAADEVGGNLDLQPTSAMPPILEHDAPGVLARGVSDLTVSDLTVEFADDVPDYCTSAVRCEGVEDVLLDGVVGAPAHGGAFLEVHGTTGVTVRNGRLDGDATAFLDVSDTAAERIFALNDAAAASVAVRGDADFTRSGNRT